MAMTYTDLKENVEEITEMDFTNSQLNMFIRQAEQKIYGFIKDLPVLRTTFSETFTASSGKVLPADCLYVHSVTQQSSGTIVNRKALVQKDLDFLLEAYPLSTQTTDTADPEVKYYALDSSTTSDESASRMVLTLAPKWATSVTIQVDYQYQPRSIVDTDGTEEQPWLGTNYDSALLNGVLIEAARFMKAEPDILQLYDQQYTLAMQQLMDAVNRLDSDSFRPKAAPAQPLTVPAPAQPPQRQEQ
jgi:hypothetical protein